jgi:glycosyltransferase involved in cell wall biosynthesis
VKNGLIPRSRPVLSLVVPTHNDGERIPALTRDVGQALGGIQYEILFVDDSADDTPAVIARVMAADPCVRVLHYDSDVPAAARPAAVVAGMRKARGAFIAVLAGGMQPPPALVSQMLAAAEDADVVVASRYLPGSDGASPSSLHSRLAAHGARLAASALFHRVRACTDPMSGFFLIRREVVDGVELRPVGPKILLEILVRGRWSRLTEVPDRVDDGQLAVEARPGPEYVRHLSALRFRGIRGRGAVRYRSERAPVGPDDPQSLDDGLPEDPEIAGKRRRRLLWTVGLLALALRLVLLPIGHWWDLTVDYNVFIDLAHNHSPYDTMQYLSHIARAAGWDNNYEYYAYPPVPLYFYYPLAKLFALLHPSATYFIPVSGTFAMPNLPWDFYLWLKLPIWIADFLLAAVLARMSGTIRGFRDYLLNPYVLLVSGAWTFDAVMVLGLVLGVYFLQRRRFVNSGLALAFGTMVKFIPAIAVPTMVLYLVKKKRPVREIALFLGAYVAGCVVLLGPFAQGVLYVLGFHSNRVGGGMNWQMFWRLGLFFPPGARLDPMSLAIGAFGTPTLIIALLLAYWYGFTSESMRLNRMILVTLLAFMIGSKLVNEQYALVIFPFAFLEARQVGGAWRWLYRLLWIVPLAFAIVRVPLDRFLWLLYHTVLGSRADSIAVTGKTGLEFPFFPWYNGYQQEAFILILGVAFTVLCIVAILWPVHPARRLWRYTLPASALQRAAPVVAAAEDDNTDKTVPEREVALQRG